MDRLKFDRGVVVVFAKIEVAKRSNDPSNDPVEVELVKYDDDGYSDAFDEEKPRKDGMEGWLAGYSFAHVS